MLTHLLTYHVCNKVIQLLEQDSITVDELSAFRVKNLDIWCDENHLRTIERTRFINAVKLLPTANANKPQVVRVSLGNEENEQLSQFDEMEACKYQRNDSKCYSIKSQIEKIPSQVLWRTFGASSFVDIISIECMYTFNIWIWTKTNITKSHQLIIRIKP